MIDPARKRLADPERPMAPEELREFLKKKAAAPTALRAESDNLSPSPEVKASLPAKSSAADEYVGKEKLGGPDVFAQFKAASAVVSDDAFALPAPGAAPKVV